VIRSKKWRAFKDRKALVIKKAVSILKSENLAPYLNILFKITSMTPASVD